MAALIGPVTMQGHAALLAGQTSYHPLPRRAFVGIICGDVAESATAELPLGLVGRGARVGDISGDAGFLAGFELFVAVVTAVGHNAQLIRIQSRLGLLRHSGQLPPVTTHVGDLVSHDQMVFGIHRGLHVVAHFSRTPVVHRAGVGISQ